MTAQPEARSVSVEHQLNIYSKAGKMAQWVRKRAPKPNDLNSVLGTRTVEGQTRLPQAGF